MTAPSLHIDFEEMVFHGFSPEQAHAVAAHLQREMERLAQQHFEAHPAWGRGDLPTALDLPALTLPPLALNPSAPALETARLAARALWGAVVPALAPAAPAGPGREAGRTRPGYRNTEVTKASPAATTPEAPGLAPRPAFFGGQAGQPAGGPLATPGRPK